MDRLKNSNYRNAIIEVVEGILKACPYKVEIDSNEDGELIEITDKGVIITFSYTYEKSEGVLDFSRFKIDFRVYNTLFVNQFSSLNSMVVKYIRDEFLKLYSEKLQEIKSKESGFKLFFSKVNELVSTPLQFDDNDNFYQLSSILNRKGFFDFPSDQAGFKQYMDQFKKDNQELYLDIISLILQSQEWVNS